MKWSSLVALLALCCVLGAKSTTRPAPTATTRPIPNILHFSEFGYSLTPLQGMQELNMTLPPTEESFTPKVSLIDQPYDGTMEQYVTLSKGRFDKAGYKTISASASGKDGAVFEYLGSLGGPELHWYAKAVRKPGHIYLATAAATITQWDAVSDRLRSCVESLRLDRP
jgi:hypothetical protein